MTVSVIAIKVESGEIIDHHQVKGVAAEDFREGGAKSSPPSLLREPRTLGRVGEISLAIVEQQISRMTVQRIVIWAGEVPIRVRNSVLCEENVQVPIVVDVA